MRLQIVTNTAAQVLGKILTAATTFFITILIARSFGVEGYGDFTKIITYISIFYLFADFGINAIYLQRDDHWQTLFGLRIILSAALLFLAIAILSFLPQGTYQGFTSLVRLGIIVYAATIIFQAIITTANAFFQKHLRYQHSTVAVGAGSILSLALIWFASRLFTTEAGIVASMFALVVGSAVAAIAALWFVKKSGQPLLPTFRLSLISPLFFASVPLGVTLLFNVVYFRIDTFILTLTRSTAEVGLYGLAYKVFELPLVLPTFVMNSVYPLFLTMLNHESGIVNQELRKKIRKVFLFMILASCFMIPVLWFVATLLPLIRPDFAVSVTALRILSLGLPFFFLTSLTMWSLIALRKQMTLMIIYSASMVLAIALDILFIPSYGYIAAAWITVISEAAVLLMSGFFLFRYLHKSDI